MLLHALLLATPPLEPLSAGAVSCTSVILRWPAATGRQPPVLEFAVWMRPATASPPPFTRYSTEPLGGTQAEVLELEAGSSFEFEVRARSVDGWAKYTAPLRERTMVPDDFPLPLLAPEVSGFVDCSTLRLRLPVLRYCFTSTHMALQYLSLIHI